MSSYPGNPSLAQDVQQRISSTFSQTLQLVERGKDQEAILGCEFILGMDPLFHSARTLLDRLKSDQRPVPLDDLRDASQDAAGGGQDDDFGDLGALDDLDDLEALDADPVPAAPSAAASGLGAVLQDLLDKRNYQQVIQVAQSQQSTIDKDPQLQAMVDTARSRIESDPYILAFIESARKAQAAGQDDEVEKLLAKARSLDPEHPAITHFEAAAPAAAGVAADEPATGADAKPEVEMLSFDAEVPPAPAAPSSAPPTGGLDEPALALDDDGSDDGDNAARIQQLLDEGQEAFDRGAYQAALDVWSRIFLIDIDNEEASRRIEEARNRKAELERHAEETFHEGINHLETQDLAAAKAAFEKVLEIEPHHGMAREYLDQLAAGQTPTVGSARDHSAEADGPSAAALAAAAGVDGEAERSLEAAVQRDRVIVVKKTDRRLIALGAGVLVVLLLGIGFLVTRWNKLFPNAAEDPATQTAAPDPTARATGMHENGNTEDAIAILQQVAPEDPRYQEAQSLIAQWQATLDAANETPEDIGPDEGMVRRRELLLTAGRDAYRLRHYIRARRYLQRAAAIETLGPLSPEDQALLDASEVEIQPLAKELQLFQEGDYARILPVLWRKREDAPNNPDINLLIVDSYYNLALRDLQQGNPAAAVSKLKDALDVDADNRELERLHRFAQTYQDQPQDLLYRIFVKYLPSH